MLPVLSGGGAGLSSTGGAGAAMTCLMPRMVLDELLALAGVEGGKGVGGWDRGPL